MFARPLARAFGESMPVAMWRRIVLEVDSVVIASWIRVWACLVISAPMEGRAATLHLTSRSGNGIVQAVRQVSTRVAPDPDRLRDFAAALAQSQRPALVMGAGIDRSGGWQAAGPTALSVPISRDVPPQL